MEDRKLSQVQTLTEQLNRGIATHHAGLLPILKEVVEILFYQGLIRVLFATDTFAMGVNAPARSVTFWRLNKPDASQASEPGKMALRPLLPQEYVQMAGRAGRRGMDTFGIVIVMADEANRCLPKEAQLRELMTGSHAKLESKFRLEYRCDLIPLLNAL